MASQSKPLAVVTGASTGIGYELAKCCAANDFDLVVVADEPEIKKAAKDFEAMGAKVDALQADLATLEGVDKLYALIGGRPVEALLANAGRGLGKGFLDQDFDDVMRVINTNITGTIYPIQKVGRDMRGRKAGRILITGSIAGFIPGTYQAVYNATKAFLDSFSFALRAEVKDAGVTVTCLMPGATKPSFSPAPTCSTRRSGKARRTIPPRSPGGGFKAMMNGEGDVVSGWQNKLQSAIANVVPASILAEQHRKKAAPGSGGTH